MKFTKQYPYSIFGYLFLIMFSFSDLKGQNLNTTVSSLKKLYPNEQAVFNKIALDMKIFLGDGEPVIKTTNYEEMIHLGSYSNNYTTNKIYTNSFETIDEIKAHTEFPYKNRTKTIKVKEFKESFDENSSFFYDDTKVLNFIFPAIASGAKTVLEYSKTLNEPRFSPGFYFQSYLPIVQANYTVTVDKNIRVDFDLRNAEGYEIELTTEENKKSIKYIYEVKKVDKYKPEENSPPLQYFVPHINLRIKDFTTSEKQKVNLLSGPQDLHFWYKSFITGLKESHDNDIKKIVDGLIDDIDNEKEQVKAIFYWVQKNIKYIAFEDGMRGFIPHNGAYVCNKRYGDCKDMASLLVNMLHHAGIEAYFTWVGTRDIPYNYTDFATPSVDNHMIATYIHEDRYYYLDATAQFSPFELPSSMIQGKETLISLKDTFMIEKVPVIDKSINTITDSISFTIKNGELIGDGIASLSGFARVFNNYKLDVTSEKEKEEYLQTLLAKGSNKFQLNNYNIRHLKDLDLPMLIEYSFSIQNYYQEIGNEIYLNLNLEKPFNNDLIDKDRVLPIENEYKYSNRNINIFTIPKGYQVSYLPINQSYEDRYFGFTIDYELKANEIILTTEYYIDYLILKPANFEDWNTAIDKLSQAYSEIGILKK